MGSDEKFIDVVAEDGSTRQAEVIFTFEDNDDKYVLFTFVDELSSATSIEDEYEVLVYMYEENEDGSIGKLIEIDEDDSYRWEIVSEVFEAFNETNFMYAEE